MARGEVERGEIIAESDDDELHVCPRGNVAFAGVDQRHSQRPGRVRSGRWTAGRQCESVQGDAPQHIVTGALLRESGPKIKTKKTGESGPQIALWLPRGLLTWMIRGRRPKADKFCIPNYMTTTDAFKKLNFQNVKYLNIFYTFLIPYNFYFFHWNHFKNFPQKLFGQILNYSKISWGQNSPTHNPPLGCGSTHSSAHPKWPKSTKKKLEKFPAYLSSGRSGMIRGGPHPPRGRNRMTETHHALSKTHSHPWGRGHLLISLLMGGKHKTNHQKAKNNPPAEMLPIGVSHPIIQLEFNHLQSLGPRNLR